VSLERTRGSERTRGREGTEVRERRTEGRTWNHFHSFLFATLFLPNDAMNWAKSWFLTSPDLSNRSKVFSNNSSFSAAQSATMADCLCAGVGALR
jgi:hypothetical protein